MKGLRLRLARLAVALGVVSLLWACNAPFIPVPPPGQVSFSSELVSDGMGGMKTLWVGRGPANPSASLARFFLFDVQRQAGVIAAGQNDGSYVSPPFEGTVKDHVEISFETPDGNLSATACVVLDVGAALPCTQ
jgi:hypothetical protein